jgi:protein-tyrosine phosphatase
MTQIQPHALWIGHAGDGRDYARISEAGIGAVVSLAAEEPSGQPPRDLLFLRFPLVDGVGNKMPWLELAITSVANLLRLEIPTLVYCGAGMSRSPTIAAAALADRAGQSLEDCLRSVVASHHADVVPGLWDEVKVVLSRMSH